MAYEFQSREDADPQQRSGISNVRTHACDILLKDRIKLSGKIFMWDGSESKMSPQPLISGCADHQIGGWDKENICSVHLPNLGIREGKIKQLRTEEDRRGRMQCKLWH